MSETTTETAPAEPGNEPDEQGQEQQELGDGGKKALQAEREARKLAEKRAAEAEAKIKAAEVAQLSDIERAQREASEAAAELAAIRAENLRNRVALSKGVPADLVEFLTGDTEEDIAAKADTLLARLNAPTSPKPDPSQGAKGGERRTTTGDQFAAFFNDNLST